MEQTITTTSVMDNILNKYISMGDGEVKSISKDRSDYHQVIAITKRIIDWEFDIKNGFELTLSENCDRVKKRKL